MSRHQENDLIVLLLRTTPRALHQDKPVYRMKTKWRHTRGQREGNFRIFRVTRRFCHIIVLHNYLLKSPSCSRDIDSRRQRQIGGSQTAPNSIWQGKPTCWGSPGIWYHSTSLVTPEPKCDPTAVTAALRPVRKRRPITTLTKLWRHNSCCVLDRGRCFSSLKLSQGAGADRLEEWTRTRGNQHSCWVHLRTHWSATICAKYVECCDSVRVCTTSSGTYLKARYQSLETFRSRTKSCSRYQADARLSAFRHKKELTICTVVQSTEMLARSQRLEVDPWMWCNMKKQTPR